MLSSKWVRISFQYEIQFKFSYEMLDVILSHPKTAFTPTPSSVTTRALQKRRVDLVAEPHSRQHKQTKNLKLEEMWCNCFEGIECIIYATDFALSSNLLLSEFTTLIPNNPGSIIVNRSLLHLILGCMEAFICPNCRHGVWCTSVDQLTIQMLDILYSKIETKNETLRTINYSGFASMETRGRG